jgi:hypothetical protein
LCIDIGKQGSAVIAQVNDSSVLPPPQPRDPPGIRPGLDFEVVARQVKAIQEKLGLSPRGRGNLCR